MLLFIVYMLRQTVLLIWVGVLIAILLSPAVDWICKWHIRRHHPSPGISLVILIVWIVIVISAFIWLASPPILRDMRGLAQEWPQRAQQLINWAHKHLPMSATLDSGDMKRYAEKLLGGVGGLLRNLTRGIINVLAVLLMAAYFILDGKLSFRWMISLFPTQRQPKLRHTLVQGGSRMRRWLGGQGLLMLIHGGSSTIAFWLLHIHYFYLLGVLAGLFNIIPVLGPILTLIVAGLVAAIDSLGKLVGVVIFYLIYHNLENAFLTPRIMESRVHLPAVAVIVALVVGDAFAGIVGILIAVPTAALVAVIIDEYLIKNSAAATLPPQETGLEDKAA